MYFDPIECGNRVRKVRKAFGYTQEDVADMLNISASHYGKFECGKAFPSIDILIELAALLHLSTDYILLGIEPHSDIAKHKIHATIEFLTAVEKEL